MKRTRIQNRQRLVLGKKVIMPLSPEEINNIKGGIATDQITNSYCCAPPPPSGGGTPCCPAPRTFLCGAPVMQ